MTRQRIWSVLRSPAIIMPEDPTGQGAESTLSYLKMRVQLPTALLVCLLPTGCEEMETSSGGETGPRHGTGIRAVSGSV